MAKQSPANDGRIDRRTVLWTGAALAAAGPALLRGAPAEAQPRPRPMTIIDSQVHAYEPNTPKRPWFRVPKWPAHVTGDEMVAAMDKVGVDGAIFISPFSMYQYDGSYAVEVQRTHPNRFALVGQSTPTTRRSPMSSPTGRKRRARSASVSSSPRKRTARRTIPASNESCAPP